MASYPGKRRLSIFAVLLTLFSFPLQAIAQDSSRNITSLDFETAAEADYSSLRLASVKASSNSQQNDFTCGPDKPCINGACCGEDGWCGYSPKYCEDGCQSNCDAKAECGRFAATPGETCPLNVCCSEHGFCGTTAEFCNDACQSNCEQPNPGGSPSNPRDLVIGYWEAWNMDKPCGTMGPGEIPVHLLTHLFVSFGYITDTWEITNMDGVDSKIFETIGNVKARNPDLKVVIALGGWAFSDPGPWVDIFPKMASNKESRATFITNLLGFMSQYGYDGVDFDWEYPGAEDRGGSDGDGENYTALLRELRQAINDSGRDYIVTFTAPSSYWYLRHFDLKGMEAEVDWINLMSYDLHGVWDSNNPIGSQVLAHTNLTEIDQALDLFWRVGVDPYNVVLGLGFYGRSFELESASCWKPGCAFQGPGAEGRCSKSAGILAYNEVVEILEQTGGTPYFDKAAAAKYMVYDGHSWISFDDAETFQLKIDYASKIGLRGLMIWAIDLDTGSLDALRAVTGRAALPGSNSPFDLVDLERLFPPEMLPPEGASKNWGLVNFGSNADRGAVDPNQTGFGFVLMTGESHAVTSLKRRKDNPDPLVFLDCPKALSQQPRDKIQKARVACLSEDIDGCFQIMERGVHGTIVEMPDNCGADTFVRAISLEKSEDQTVPTIKGRKALTSEIFDFAFDLNFHQKRQDAGKISVRVDYSNANGYWNSAVDSPGAGKSSSQKGKRYWSPLNSDWRDKYGDAEDLMGGSERRDIEIKEDIGTPIFWDDVGNCDIDGDDYNKAFGAHLEGELDVEFTYGFSMITEIEDILNVRQANGFLKVKGNADLSFSAGGVGELDLDKSGYGSIAESDVSSIRRKDHTIETGASGVAMTFKPYWKLNYMLQATNASGSGSADPSGLHFDGQLNARVKQDFGDYQVNFPPNPEDKDGSRNIDRRDNDISIPDEYNVLYSGTTDNGRLSLASIFTFGLEVKFELFGRAGSRSIDLTDMQAYYRTMTSFDFVRPKDDSADTCVETQVGTYGNQAYNIDEDDTLGWGVAKGVPWVIQDVQSPSDGAACYAQQPSMGLGMAWGWGPGDEVIPQVLMPSDTYEDFGSRKNDIFKCVNCLGCGEDEEDEDTACCGCVNLNLMFPKYDDIPECPSCTDDDTTDGSWPGVLNSLSLTEEDVRDMNRAVGLEDDASEPNLQERTPGTATLSEKKVTACPKSNPVPFSVGSNYRYPAFPASPFNPWDGIQQGKWDSISKYWGNMSNSCSNWKTTDLFPHDEVWVGQANGLQRVRDKYQTEHVFEGQLIGDFFNMWLEKGYIKRQKPMPSNPTPKSSCGAFLERYLLRVDQNSYPWELDGDPAPFIDLMLAELGNQEHRDRLTILKARPNRMKGSMFTGNEPTSLSRYSKMSPDAQLTATKDFGMVFTYLNQPAVWDAFCGTYEAIYDLLGEWDDWWDTNGSGHTPPSLQDEWKEYIETVLTSLVRRGRSTLKFHQTVAEKRLPKGSARKVYKRHWDINMSTNAKLININGQCNNLGSIRP